MIAQLLHVTLANLRALPGRWGASLVVVLGMAGVVAVMVALLAMGEGFRQTFSKAGSPERVVVVKTAEDSGTTSALTREQVSIVFDLPGFAKDADGKPVAVGQKFMTSELRQRATGHGVGAVLRGVSEKAWRLWPEVKIVEGRAFTPGRREAVIGRAAQNEFAGTAVGETVELANGPWTIVGVFEAPGTLFESELWGDVEMVFPGYSITGQFSSVVGKLESPASLPVLRDALTTNPQLAHVVKTEADHYATLSGNLGGTMVVFGYAVAGIMGLGALFSAINTLYASVKVRSREIATLRALGFGAAPIVGSVLVEALVLCALGAALGGALAFMLFDGYALSTIGGGANEMSQIMFAFQVTGPLLLQGMVLGCAIALVGGLLPAIRAARLPIAEALRSA